MRAHLFAGCPVGPWRRPLGRRVKTAHGTGRREHEARGEPQRGREAWRERGRERGGTVFHRLPTVNVAPPTGQACKNSTWHWPPSRSWLARAKFSRGRRSARRRGGRVRVRVSSWPARAKFSRGVARAAAGEKSMTKSMTRATTLRRARAHVSRESGERARGGGGGATRRGDRRREGRRDEDDAPRR